MGRLAIFAVILFCLISFVNESSASADVQPQSDWLDTYYQYQIPIEIESRQAGWQEIPIDEEMITRAVNDIEEFHYDPIYFAYNYLKVAGKDKDANSAWIDKAGFYLIPEGKELFDKSWLGQEKATIPVEAGEYYLIRYLSANGGQSPVARYAPAGYTPEERKEFSTISYEPPTLPLKQGRQDVLFLSDGNPLVLTLTGNHTTEIRELSVRKVRIALLADIKQPGKAQLMLYYQPMCSHHLMVPEVWQSRSSTDDATLVAIGSARKYRGNTAYRVAASDVADIWFAESTVKMTPNTVPPERSESAVRISSAANESQSFQLVISPKKPLKLTNVTMSALKGPQGKQIPVENVSIKKVEYVPTFPSSFITPARYQGLVGDPLVDIVPRTIWQQDGNYVLWVDLAVPAGSAPGEYVGEIHVERESQPPIVLPVTLEVYGFELPEFSPFQGALGGNFFLTRRGQDKKHIVDYHGLPESEVGPLSAKYFDVMVKNKFWPKNVGGAIKMKWEAPPKGLNVDAPGNFFTISDWDFTEYNSKLSHYINELKLNSICILHTNPNVCNTIQLSNPYALFAWDMNSAETGNIKAISQAQYDRLLIDYLRPIAANLDKNGWLDKAYILVDETTNDKRFLHFLRVLNSDPLTAKIRIVACAQGTEYYTLKDKQGKDGFAYRDLIDTYMPQIDECYNRWEKFFITDYRLKSDFSNFGFYDVFTSRISIDTPGINNRILGLDVFNRGGGFYHLSESFMYDDDEFRSKSPWTNPYTRFGNGAYAYFYPPQRDGVAAKPDWTITPSLRIMTYRESVDDYEYARMLTDALHNTGDSNPDAKKEIESVLSDIDRYFHNSVHWSQNDAWYLDLRRRMAHAIAKYHP